MHIFVTAKRPYKWLYMSNENVKYYLSQTPYLINGRFYALCPYCKSAIQIIQKANAHGSSELFGRHLKKAPSTDLKVFPDRVKFCQFNSPPRLFIPDNLNHNQTLDWKKFDREIIRKALSSYTGIFFSNRLLSTFLIKWQQMALSYRDVNETNFPFVLLLASDQNINLYGRKCASPKIINQIQNNSIYFQINDNCQIVAIDKYKKSAQIALFFGQQKLSKYDLPYFEFSIVEKNGDNIHVVYKFNCYVRMTPKLIK